MKKFLNSKENITSELLEGLALANQDKLYLEDGNLIINKKLDSANRVTIVTFGGTGHEPAIEGFVGEGMIDICVCGDIFAAPGFQSVVSAIKKADKGHGVLLIVLNHAGDMMTGNLAMNECAKLGINVKKVVTEEDISNAPRTDKGNRRGLVGCVAAYKIASAAALDFKTLDEVAAITEKFANNMATLAVALKGATHPQTGLMISELPEDMMEIGMGQHGEGGGGLQPVLSADETAVIMVDALIKDLDIKTGENILLFINGSGSTTLMEQLIIFRKCYQYLESLGITVVANIVGEILTVQEQAGFQMMMARMDATELKYFEAPCNSPYLRK